jgi:hypothetical protein
MSAGFQGNGAPSSESEFGGFRLAMIPEPGTGLLVVLGLVGFGGWRRGQPTSR